MKVKAKSSFNHDGKNHNPGEEFDVSDQLAKELSDKGLVEKTEGDDDNDPSGEQARQGGELGAKDAPTHPNKMAPQQQGKSPGDIVGGIGGTPAPQSPNVTPGGKPTK